jgi:ATP/maltotriose-dependent transcriptional regulator MalT
MAEDWKSAANTWSNLSKTELLAGEIAAAAVTGKSSVARADRADDAFQMISNRTTYAEALHAAGELAKASDNFAEAERRQGERQPEYPLLYSVQGYRYCDLLLSLGRPEEARQQAARAFERILPQKWVLDAALDTLTICRANLFLALQSLLGAAATFRESVDGLRASERNDYLPRGLLARAAFRRAVGDWDGAKRDLEEVKEIAESGLMRLYWCDCALEDARLALARREAFAPLNGLIETSPPPPDATVAAALREEAREQLDVARKLIAECRYHRRDEELAELDDVVAGRRRFADLPPGV